MAQDNFKIESGLEIPPMQRVARESKYPFSKMRVNDSFFVPDVKPSTLHACITRFQKGPNGIEKNKPKKFVTRSVKEGNKNGVRVWRTE